MTNGKDMAAEAAKLEVDLSDEVQRRTLPEALLNYIYTVKRMDEHVKQKALYLANRLEEQLPTLDEEEKRALQDIIKRLRDAVEEENLKQLISAVESNIRYNKRYGDPLSSMPRSQPTTQAVATQVPQGSRKPTKASTQKAIVPANPGTQTSTAPGSPGQNVPSVIQIDPAVLEYAALLRAREKIFQGSYHVKDLLSRENLIVQNYKQYLKQRLSAGKDDNERAQILQQEMELLKSVTYHETVRDGINKWWRRHPVARTVIGLGMLGAGIAAMFVNPILGAGLLIARGLWNGFATWMAVEGGYDALNHVWRRSREDGAHRIIRSTMTNRDIRQEDIIDAVHMGPDVTADRIVAGGLDVTRNIRGHRIVKRILSIAAATIVGMITGVWQGITSLFSAHDTAASGVGFGDHVKDGAHATLNKINSANGCYVYTAEPGGSVWNGAEQAVDWYAAQHGIHLTPAERLYAIDFVKDRVCENLAAHGIFRTVPTDAPTAPWIYPKQNVFIYLKEIVNGIRGAKEFYGGGELLDAAGAFKSGGGAAAGRCLFDTVTGKLHFVPLRR